MTKSEFMNRSNPLQDPLFAFAMKLTQDRENAKDLYQETLTRAYANKDRFSMGTNFKAWITTIMRNNFINEYRKRRTRNKVEKPLENNMEFAAKKAVQNNGQSLIFRKELHHILHELKDSQRIPFEMHFKGYEYQEIADKMNLPIGTVKSRIYFARKKLRRMIRERYMLK
ncbi:MAG: RNA polymerase sigma factor [Lewinellaceae bacterium]|nr:RNA polymerase sigma factor [Lewinellaceae bacterium]